MKPVIYGICAMFIISFIAWGISETISETSGEKYISQNNSVRLD